MQMLLDKKVKDEAMEEEEKRKTKVTSGMKTEYKKRL